MRAITVIDQSARRHVLLTSLFDRQRYKASDIAQCYARRWHIETSYRELKQSMLGMALTLRSKTTDGVYQEIWGALTAYNLVRLEMAKAALEVKCDPTEISFIRAFHVFQYELRWAAVTRAQGKLPALLKRLRKRLVDLLNEKRPGRKFDRAVKAISLHTNLSCLISTNSGGEIHHPLQTSPDGLDTGFTIAFAPQEAAEAGDETYHGV